MDQSGRTGAPSHTLLTSVNGFLIPVVGTAALLAVN